MCLAEDDDGLAPGVSLSAGRSIRPRKAGTPSREKLLSVTNSPPAGGCSRRLIQRSGIMHGGRRDDVGVEKRIGCGVDAERHGQRPENGQSYRWRTLEDAEGEPDVLPGTRGTHASWTAERVPMFQFLVGPCLP